MQKHGEEFPTPIQTIPQICMMSSSESYDHDFPPLKKYETSDENGTSSQQPKILNPTIKDADGTPKKISPAEEVLNWQSENLIAQNKILKKIDKRTKVLQTSHEALVERLSAKIQQIRDELMEIIRTNTVPMTVFLQKEDELKNLKNQYFSITGQHSQFPGGGHFSQTSGGGHFSQFPQMPTTPWQFSTMQKIPEIPQAVPIPQPQGTSILRLKEIIE